MPYSLPSFTNSLFDSFTELNIPNPFICLFDDIDVSLNWERLLVIVYYLHARFVLLCGPY